MSESSQKTIFIATFSLLFLIGTVFSGPIPWEISSPSTHTLVNFITGVTTSSRVVVLSTFQGGYASSPLELPYNWTAHYSFILDGKILNDSHVEWFSVCSFANSPSFYASVSLSPSHEAILVEANLNEGEEVWYFKNVTSLPPTATSLACGQNKIIATSPTNAYSATLTEEEISPWLLVLTVPFYQYTHFAPFYLALNQTFVLSHEANGAVNWTQSTVASPHRNSLFCAGGNTKTTVVAGSYGSWSANDISFFSQTSNFNFDAMVYDEENDIFYGSTLAEVLFTNQMVKSITGFDWTTTGPILDNSSVYPISLLYVGNGCGTLALASSGVVVQMNEPFNANYIEYMFFLGQSVAYGNGIFYLTAKSDSGEYLTWSSNNPQNVSSFTEVSGSQLMKLQIYYFEWVDELNAFLGYSLSELFISSDFIEWTLLLDVNEYINNLVILQPKNGKESTDWTGSISSFAVNDDQVTLLAVENIYVYPQGGKYFTLIFTAPLNDLTSWELVYNSSTSVLTGQLFFNSFTNEYITTNYENNLIYSTNLVDWTITTVNLICDSFYSKNEFLICYNIYNVSFADIKSYYDQNDWTESSFGFKSSQFFINGDNFIVTSQGGGTYSFTSELTQFNEYKFIPLMSEYIFLGFTLGTDVNGNSVIIGANGNAIVTAQLD